MNSVNYVIVKRSSKILENSFLKNGILEFWAETEIVSILRCSSKDYDVHNQNMIYAKIVITKFYEILRKLSFMLFSGIRMMKTVCQMPKKSFILTHSFWIIKVASFRVTNPDSKGVNLETLMIWDVLRASPIVCALVWGGLWRGEMAGAWTVGRFGLGRLSNPPRIFSFSLRIPIAK